MMRPYVLHHVSLEARVAHRQRQAQELRRYAVALGDHPEAPLIRARADQLEALVKELRRCCSE